MHDDVLRVVLRAVLDNRISATHSILNQAGDKLPVDCRSQQQGILERPQRTSASLENYYNTNTVL